MESLITLFKFIDTIDIPVEEFEKNCSLELGTLRKAQENKISLPKEITSKIAKKYGSDMDELGFMIVDGNAFGRETDLIIERDINNIFQK